MKQPKLEIYKSKGGYRWRLVSINGRIVAESGEALTKKPTPVYMEKIVNGLVVAIFNAGKMELKP